MHLSPLVLDEAMKKRYIENTLNSEITSLLLNKSDDSAAKLEESATIDTTASHLHYSPGKGWEEFKEDNGTTLSASDSDQKVAAEEMAINNDDLPPLDTFDVEEWVIVGAADEVEIG
jgi:hypothetical protein